MVTQPVNKIVGVRCRMYRVHEVTTKQQIIEKIAER
jgi:hypothetical protein